MVLYILHQILVHQDLMKNMSKNFLISNKIAILVLPYKPLYMKKICFLGLALLMTIASFAKDKDSLTLAVEKYFALRDSVNNAMHYESGLVKSSNSKIEFDVPKGFKFLNKEQSKYVVETLWGNLPQENLIGMLFPASGGPFDDSSYAFIITSEDMGYVKDDDAEKIDYDELLKNMQKDEVDENKKRISQGLKPLYTVGWAEKPFYDKNNKVLHWAFRLKEGESEDLTLNYRVILLGRKGILTMNAVAPVTALDSVKSHIKEVLAIPKFTEGNSYKDFDPKVDQVAAWTIGALVAGKVLAKVGLFALFGKFFLAFWKFILVGLAAIGGGFKKFFRRNKSVEQNSEPENELVETTQTEEKSKGAE
jgi:uncharacterized membrane-anchored protein